MGSCVLYTAANCALNGCIEADGYAYCTKCLPDYGTTPVDGACIKRTLPDDTTNKWCTVIVNGECTQCDSQYFLDVNDSMSGFPLLRNTC